MDLKLKNQKTTITSVRLDTDAIINFERMTRSHGKDYKIKERIKLYLNQEIWRPVLNNMLNAIRRNQLFTSDGKLNWRRITYGTQIRATNGYDGLDAKEFLKETMHYLLESKKPEERHLQ